MKWTYSIKNKLTTSMLLLGVVLVVFFNNLNERRNSRELRIAFDSIYQDRLLAESYILKLTANLHALDETCVGSGVGKFALTEEKLAEIQTLNQLYRETKLTEKEAEYFNHYTDLTDKIDVQIKTANFETAGLNINDALLDLESLSEIQVKEAEMIMLKTDKMLNVGSISSQFEMGVIIIIGLIIQVLLFASKTLQFNKSNPDTRLN
jgi:hypothetical protein